MALYETAKRVREEIVDDNPDALFADDFDAAIIGIARRCGQPSLVAYSYSKAVAWLMSAEGGGMSYDDAIEWMEINVVGAWMGEDSPIWVMGDD